MSALPVPLRLRSSEWLSLAFFVYAAALVPWFHDRPHLGFTPFVLIALVAGLYATLAAAEHYGPSKVFNYTRDWVIIGVTLLAYREMDLFRPQHFLHVHEAQWIRQDIALLGSTPVNKVLSGSGPLLPFYFEACYFLVYGTAAFSVAAFYFLHRRWLIDRFYLVYLTGTLGAYAFFPFFPSEPPRFVYPDIAMPAVVTWMRGVNLFLLRTGSIHVSVYPSAHVSSAFSAAWALFLLLPDRKIFGTVALVYAMSVAMATIYGRYHYTADAVAGFWVSVAALAISGVVRALRIRYRCASLAPAR